MLSQIYEMKSWNWLKKSIMIWKYEKSQIWEKYDKSFMTKSRNYDLNS